MQRYFILMPCGRTGYERIRQAQHTHASNPDILKEKKTKDALKKGQKPKIGIPNFFFSAPSSGQFPKNRGESIITKLPMRNKQWQRDHKEDQTTMSRMNRMTVFVCFFTK